MSQTNRSERFRTSAPGKRRASHRTWKPLHVPSTSLPARASLITARIIGEKRDGAAAEIIPVGESPWENDGVKIIKRCLLMPDVFSTQALKAANRSHAILIPM